MNKKIFFNQDGVTVSQSRLTVNGQIYEINKISTVSYKKLPPNYGYSVFFVLVGVLLLLDEGELFALGGCLIMIGVIAAYLTQPKHVAVIDICGRSIDAVISTDHSHVDRVIQAIQTSKANSQASETINLSFSQTEEKESTTFTSRAVE